MWFAVYVQAEEAKVKILEVAGDRVDNKSKLEVIRQEEEIIRREKEERKKEEEAERLAKIKVLAAEAAAAADVVQVLVNAACGLREL